MKFCSACGHTVNHVIPADDTRLRAVCPACGVIHYENPRMVVGTIPLWMENGSPRILLCKRAIEPRHGYWTLPGGFMENGETAAEGAARETVEEAGAHIQIGPLFSLINVVHVQQVHLFYRARLLDLDFAPGTESLDVRLFSQAEIPWKELAFNTVSTTLHAYFQTLEREGHAEPACPAAYSPVFSADIVPVATATETAVLPGQVTS